MPTPCGAVNIIVFGIGCSIGWFSPSLLLFSSSNSPLVGDPLTSDVIGWLGASPSLGSIVGTCIYGLLATSIGYNKALLLSSVPITVSI